MTPTIVAASLSDSELRTSIDKLVQYVEKGTKRMADSFDAQVERMKKSLASLGGFKASTSASSVSSSVEKEAVSYDKLAAAAKRAAKGKKEASLEYVTSDIDKSLTYIIDHSKNIEKQLEAIMRKEQALAEAKRREVEETLALAQAQQQVRAGVSGSSIGYGTVEDMQNQSIRNRVINTRSLIAETKTLEQTVASLIGVESRDLNLNTSITSSYSALSNLIGQLTKAYREMTQQERDSAIGRELAEKIQQTSRALQEIQKQMNRPTDIKNVLGLDEKTLDSISYKMQQLSLYRSGLDVNVRKNEIEQVNREYDRLKKKMDEVMQKNNGLMASNQALGRSWNYMKNRLAFYFTVGASTAFIKNLIEVRSQYEMNERALGILINSAERGTEIFQELSSMALVSPYTLIELSNAAKQLVAYDVAAKDVVETTRRLADMASAVGVPMERLTYALGQIKAYGYLNSRDARMFANAGIPLVKQLADYYTQLEGRLVSTADVYDRIKKKTIDYADVMQVINRMTDEGGKFFDFQAKMADTLKVRLANLTLAWNNMLNDIGQESQGILTTGISLLRDLFLQWKSIDSMIWAAVKAFGMFKGFQTILIAIHGLDLFGKKLTWNILLGKKLTNVMYTLAATLKQVFLSPTTWIMAIGAAIVYAIQSAQDAKKAMEELNNSIRESAKEASQNLSKYLYSDVSKELKAMAESNVLSQTEGEKAWEAMREQIENASSASDIFIAQLLKEEDINKRVTDAYNVAEKIREANDALSDFGAYMVATQDTLDTSIATAVKDGLADLKGDIGFGEALRNAFFGRGESGTSPYMNMLIRMQELGMYVGKVLEEELGEEGLLDKIKVAEAVERIRQQIKRAYPEIQGDVAKLFDVEYDKYVGMFVNLGVTRVFDETTSLTRMVLDHLTKDSRSVFDGLTDEILSDTETWNDAQIAAIQKAIDKVKNEVPREFSITLDDMMRDLNSRDWKINIISSMGVEVLDDVRKEQRAHFIGGISQYASKKDYNNAVSRWSTILRKNEEADIDYEKRLQEEKEKTKKAIERNTAALGAESKAVRDEAAEQKKLNERHLQDIEAVQKFGNYRDKESKKSGSKDTLGDAISKEVQIIGEMQKRYKEYLKMGVNQQNALTLAAEEYNNTLLTQNAILKSVGIPTLEPKQLASMPLNDIRDIYKKQLEVARALGNTKGVEALEKAIASINVEITKIDYKKITDGLNNELNKIKDEYELAVELDANPEFGGAFAEMFGIDMSQLPRTAAEYADKYTKAINDALQKEYPNLEIPNLLDMTDSDLEKFRKLVDTEQLGEMWYELIEKGYKAAQDIRQKEAKETIKEWSTLVEKYGGLQAKLLKIYKDSVQEQLNIIRNFGNGEEVKQALDLVSRINISQDPTEIARLQGELADVIKKVAERNPQAGKIYEATNNSQKRLTSQAYWDDFKDSDLYTMTFEDMSNNSVRAIRAIIKALNDVKDKVKEDPASMKALMKSLEDAEKELVERDPFGSLARSVGEYAKAMNEARDARRNLNDAEKEEKEAKKDVKKAGTDPNKLADAQARLTAATKKRQQAQVALTSAENKAQKASKNFRSSLQNISDQLGNVKEVFGVVAEIFRMGGDDKTADAIDEICSGFSAMTTLIMGVVVAMEVLQSTSPWLLAISAALSVIVGLVNFLINADNKAIDKKVEESERRVKRLELAYLDLEQAAKDAYGTDIIGAQKAALANKQLQLAELQRQIELEKSRQTKFRDEEKILDLQKSYKELALEIHNDTEQIVNDLLSVSSRASFAEDLVSSMVDAFKNGEDYMAVFEEKFEDMVDSLIIKAITSKVVGAYIDQLFDQMQERIDERTQTPAERYATAQAELTRVQNMSDVELQRELYRQGHSVVGIATTANKYRQQVQDDYDRAEAELREAQKMTNDDIRQFIADSKSVSGELAPLLEAAIKEWYTFGQDADNATQLSALQAGIQGVTEDTASAVEAYLNGMSQQAYLRNDLLTQIRDTIMSFDIDIQTASLSQILLQLQSSYQLHQSMLLTMENWTNPSGNAVRVELIS